MRDKLCYLNGIYTDFNDETLYYELVFSDANFINVRLKIVGFDELVAYSNDEEYLTDFKIEDGFLKCCNEVNRVEYHDIVKVDEEINCFDKKSFSLYSLLELGVKNRFYVVDEEVLEHDSWKGNGIVSFRNVLFSQSSMSIYVKMMIDNRLYHKPLVKVKDGLIKIVPFHFLVPDDYKEVIPDCTFVKRIVVNNVQYSVYRSDVTEVFESLNKIVPPLINKACTVSVRSKSAIKVLKAYKGIFCEQLGIKIEKPEWAGGDKPREVTDTINFKPSAKVLSQPTELAAQILGMCAKSDSFDDVRKEILASGGSPEYMYTALNVALVAKVSESSAEMMENLNEVLKRLETERFYADIFTYKIRMFSLISRRPLTSAIKPFFFGSEVGGYTQVMKGISSYE